LIKRKALKIRKKLIRKGMQRRKKRKRRIKMSLPRDLRYREYVWVKVEGEVATLGVTEYPIEAAKEIVFVDLPKMGQRIEKDGTFVSLESVKWSGHIASPISGEVMAVNDSLFDEPEKLNQDPYANWICRVRISDRSELDGLVDADAAEEWARENLG
jgi:glycine cleavage system H protein